jgi:hypothetical protein
MKPMPTMIDRVVDLITPITQQIVAQGYDELGSGYLSVKHRETLGLLALSLHDLLMLPSMQHVDRVLLEKLLYKIFQVIYDEEALSYFSSFYYSLKKVGRGDINEIQHEFAKSNLDILAIRLKLRLVQMGRARFGDSTDRYFFSNLDRLLRGINALFQKHNTQLYQLGLYTLLNLHQSLLELAGADEALRVYSIGESTYLLQRSHERLEALITWPDVKSVYEDNPQLGFFLIDQQRKYQEIMGQLVTATFPKIDIADRPWTPQLWAIRSLGFHTPALFGQLIEENLPVWHKYASEWELRAQVLLLSVLTHYLQQNNYQSMLHLDLSYRSQDQIDLDTFMPMYFSHYQDIPKTQVEQEDMNRLFSFDDPELRKRFGNSITNIDQVVVHREARKPHGVAEIADMELPIRLNPNRTYYLCIPFKSAAEIRTDTVPISYAYQITRPFSFFDNCVVVFVTAKRCSQPLLNDIKQVREKHNWPIAVIEHNELAALLKLNGQL